MPTHALATKGSGEQFRLDYILGARVVEGGLFAVGNEVLYSAGAVTVLQDIATRSQRFIESGKITAMTANHSHVGVAEKETGVVKFYDMVSLRLRCKLSTGSISNIQHVSISKDSSKCLVMGGPPDYTLTMWDLERENTTAYASIRFSTITKSAIASADISPTNNTLISVIGRKTIRLFHVSNRSNKFMPVETNLRIEPQNYIAQTWVSSGELVIGAEAGSIVVMGDDKRTDQLLKVNHSISAITSFPKGFIVGCNEGAIVLFQRPNKTGGYSAIRVIHLDNETGIVALAVTKNQASPSCICLGRNCSIMKISLASASSKDTDCREIELSPSLNQSVRKIESLIPDSGALFVDCCAWTPLVAIGGWDGFVRIFNRLDNAVVMTHRFEEKICHLSFHPSGEYLLVSTSSVVCFCTILLDELVVTWQLEDLSQPALVSFSQDRFVITMGAAVQVHDLYALQNVSKLQGHNKEIIEVTFRKHNDELITVGVDGVVCLWDINRGIAVSRIVDAASRSFIAACVSHDQKHVYALSSDCWMKKINVENSEHEPELYSDKILIDTPALMVALPSDNLIISSTKNVVHVYSTHDSLKIQHSIHQGKATSIQYTKDSSGCLVCADKDGFVIVYKLLFGSMMELCGKTLNSYRPLDGIAVIASTFYEEKVDQIKFVEDSIQSFEMAHALTFDSSNFTHVDNKASICEKLQLQLDRLQYEEQQLIDKIQSLKIKHTSEISRLKKQHGTNLNLVREDCKKKLAMERCHMEQVVDMRETVSTSHNMQLSKMTKDHLATIDRETRTLHGLINNENEKNEGYVKTIDTTRDHALELERKMEQDAETEISKLNFSHRKDMASLRRSNIHFQNEHDVLKQRHLTLLSDLKELQEQVYSQEEKLRSNEEMMKDLDISIEANVVDISKKENIIQKHEQDLCFLSQSNLEEERALTDLVEARGKMEDMLLMEEEGVKRKELEKNEKKGELKENLKRGKITHIEMNGLELKLKQLRVNLSSTQLKWEKKKQLLTKLENGIMEAMSHIDDHKSLKVSLCALSQKYLHTTSKRMPTCLVSVAEKLLLMNKKISTVQESISRKEKSHKNEMQRLLREHASLEKELQEFKKFKSGGPLSDNNRVNKQELQSKNKPNRDIHT